MATLKKEERTMSDWTILKRSFQYIRPHWRRFLLAISLMIIVIALELAGPYLTGSVVEHLSKPEDYTYLSVLAFALGYLGCVLSSLGFMYLETMILQKTGQEIVYQLRQDVFSYIEKLSIAQIHEIPIGKFVSRVTSDTSSVNELYTTILVNLMKNFISLFGVIGMMFFLDVRIASWMMIFLPLVAVLSFIFRFLSRKAYRNVRHEMTAMSAFLNENLSGMKITQIFNQEKKKEQEFDTANHRLVKAKSKQNIVFAIFRPTISFLYMAAVAFLLYLGIKRVGLPIEEGGISIQVLWSFNEYISRFFNPIQTLADQFNGLQRAFAASERLFLLMDMKPDLEDEEDAMELEEVKGEIIFDHVWFAYQGEDWILKDVSFTVHPKETVAFVGATGAGKTTILSLIVRNYEIQKGTIYIDGIDIRKIKMSSLRKHIGQMLQDVFLFSGTIESNLNMRDDSIPHEKVVASARYIGADQMIDRLEHGYEEPVKERGENFSSGQRQLLSFTRTLVHDPSIMILDEATANIDTETEVLIQQSLEKMMNIGTMLIVAHRLSTIQHADQIIVLQKGEIIERGTHQALLKKRGYYYNLYRLQFEHSE